MTFIDSTYPDPMSRHHARDPEQDARISKLELLFGQRDSYGVSLWRSNNQAAIAATATAHLAFDYVLQSAGPFASVGSLPGATDSFVIPPGGAGLYALDGALYYPPGISGVYVSITVNGIAQVGVAAQGTEDRGFVSTHWYLVPGDVVRLHIRNASASVITPISYGGDNTSPAMPSLRIWRVSK